MKAGADAGPPVWEQVVQDGVPDPAGRAGAGGQDAVGLDERLGGGMQGGGEAGPVGVGSWHGLDGGDHGPPHAICPVIR